MEYACYKDDKFICIGTLKEIAEYFGTTASGVSHAKKKFGMNNRQYTKK